jgi:ComF family protein
MWLLSGSKSNQTSLIIVHRFKYSGSVWLGPVMARLMFDAFSRDRRALTDEILIPIPLHPTRKRERGYNQSALLARHLSSLAGVETRDILVRTRRTRSQTELDAGQRRKNVLNAFAAKCNCRGVRVVIVDDVATSGATIVEAAKAIRSAGGTVEGAVTFVRA